MDLRAMLNNDAPAPTVSSSASPLRPPVQQPQPRRPAPPPPIQPPHSPFPSPNQRPYVHSQHSPYTASPTTSKPAYPFPSPAQSSQFPPPQSPLSHHHQQQGYASSPISTPHGTPHTPHPLSAHSTVHSGTPTSTVSSSPHTHFPPPQPPPQQQGQSHHYSPLQQQQHHQHQQHQPFPQPPPPPSHYPSLPQHQQHGYHRPSPIASPVEGRSNFIAPTSDRAASSIGSSLAARERERERERMERERERQRQRERDVSISPKTKVPYLPVPDDDFSPVIKKEPGYRGDSTSSGTLSRPTSQPQQYPPPPPPQSGLMSQQQQQQQHQHQPPQHQQHVDYPRPNSAVAGQDRRGDAMDVDNTTPEERKWNADKIKLNGSGSERRDDQNQGHAAPQHSMNNLSHQHQKSPPTKEPPTSQPQRSMPTNSSANSARAPAPPSPKSQPHQQHLRPPPTPNQRPDNASDGQSSSPSSSGPPRKRPKRNDEAPIWARKASRSSSSSPVMANRRPHPQLQQSSQHQPPQNQSAPQHSAPPPPPTGQPARPPTSMHPGPPVPQASVPKMLPGFHRPWEQNIINKDQYDEIASQVAGFLFHNVVSQDDPALVGGGPDAPIIEIEAKLGHIIDRNMNHRLRLPVRTETILDTQDPGLKVQFRSSMTDMQHRHFNQFLNQIYMDSKRGALDPEPSRVPLEYLHTRECDSFYELPPDQYDILPRTIRETRNPRHSVRVRATTDQKTGKVIKKIIKTRIADLNVYSPLTAFDWRISVNMEMPYNGDLERLTPAGGGGANSSDGDRNKDRMSYRHIIYQVDLTQVTDKHGKKEHELEVEVDGEEIRKQGMLLREKRPNSYEQLIKGFVDNVRVLIRAVPPPER